MDKLKEIFTMNDGETLEPVFVAFWIGFFSLLMFTGWTIYKGAAFDAMAFAGGVSALIAGTGFARRMDKDESGGKT